MGNFCVGCGNAIHATALACPKCGAPQQAARPRYGKSKVTAAILAILLGGIGVHKFYLNQPGWGILYILFCWTFIPGLVGLVEGIVYLCQSDEDFARNYG
jgi:TM2 domain-containing membrane protein YozV